MFSRILVLFPNLFYRLENKPGKYYNNKKFFRGPGGDFSKKPPGRRRQK
jgi:hypothetical protein